MCNCVKAAIILVFFFCTLSPRIIILLIELKFSTLLYFFFKVIRTYTSRIQQTLDILFLGEGREFMTSTDMVSQDSADCTLIAWDFTTTAKVSNQIFHERYTCPSLALHPQEDSFVAQTNGNYIALFSAQRPYRMNKMKRFEGHKVSLFNCCSGTV
uniref:Uncharacterized protein n=1 Tax=Astyanax mexicanus TaxID=7994 RepID=A0A8B9J5D7_ASTMX